MSLFTEIILWKITLFTLTLQFRMNDQSVLTVGIKFKPTLMEVQCRFSLLRCTASADKSCAHRRCASSTCYKHSPLGAAWGKLQAHATFHRNYVITSAAAASKMSFSNRAEFGCLIILWAGHNHSAGQRWPVVLEFNSGGLKAKIAVIAEDHGSFFTLDGILASSLVVVYF